MSYWEAVLGTATVLGVMVAGFAATASIMLALAFAFNFSAPPWWVRVLAGLYAIVAVILGVALIVWDVNN